MTGKTVFSQTDTLRLYYKGLDTKIPDTTAAKIVSWAKSLKGQHVDVNVIAYYDKSDFKEFATTRADEMFLELNRKARELVTIQSYKAGKGVKSQRSRVDVIYSKTITAEEKALAEKAEKEKKAKAEEEKKAKAKEAMAKNENANKPGDNKGTTGKPKGEEDKYGRPGTHYAGEGQFLKGSEVKQIQASKIILAQTGDKETDDAFERAVKDFWTFTSDIKAMPYKEAKALAKTDESVLIFIVASVKSKSLPHHSAGSTFKQSWTEISQGCALMLENGKGKALASSYIPSFGSNDMVTEEVFAFGVSALNYQLKTMVEKDMPNNLKIKSAYKENSEKLKLKTLYIPEDWISKKLDVAQIGNIYKSKFEVVSYETWREAILGKKEDVAYVIIVPVPIGGNFLYIHYLVDAQTGMVYAMCQPKGVSVSGVNVSKANTGLINDRNIEKYNDAISGDW